MHLAIKIKTFLHKIIKDTFTSTESFWYQNASETQASGSGT